jgi:hypothetical protein
MIDHFDGTNWTASSAPSPGFYNDLNAVSATSASDAWAVGTYITTSASRHTLILHWDGTLAFPAKTPMARRNVSPGCCQCSSVTGR